MSRSMLSRRQRGPTVESPHHSNPDPATITTTSGENNPIITEESHQDSVVQPSLDENVTNLSPNASTALNAFKYMLQALGQIPVPGIGAVTTALLQVVKGIQEVPQVEAGWKELAECMARLLFLMRKISASPEFQGEMEQYCTPLNDELVKLSKDIKKALEEGGLLQFFNSTDASTSLLAHKKKLDSIVNDLTAALCMNTALTKFDLRTHLDEVVSWLHEMLSSTSPVSDAAVIRMTENTMDEVIGPVLTGNQLSRNANITMANNKFGKVGGAVLSHNVIGL